MKSFRLAALAVFAAATVPRLAHRGMFVDGVTYASIARNLAEGRGTFWVPSYTATLYPQFHEHPPLGFWLQSQWFRLLGDHLFVERLYTAVVALATGVLIAAIWRRLDADRPASGDHATEDDGRGTDRYSGRNDRGRGEDGQYGQNSLDWMPIVLWIAVPVVSWSIVGNLLETTVALFTTGAVLSALAAVADTSGESPRDSSANKVTALVAAAGWSVLSGLCIVAAGLTKGPVGLFPLVAPAAFLLLPDGRHAWRALVVQWTTVAACALILWTSGTARASLTEYVNQQVMAALAGQREVSSSMAIVKTLLQGVLLPMVGAGALAVAAARRFVLPSPATRIRAFVFFSVGLSGTLPILASAKQAGHYLVPAVPLFALAVALIIGSTVRQAVNRFGGRRQRRAINIVSALVVLGTLVASFIPALGRDRERLADLDSMASVVPRDRTLGLCPEANSDWGLHAWFERRFRVSLDAATGQRRDWFLQIARASEGCVPATCSAATDPRRPLVLMKCRRSD